MNVDGLIPAGLFELIGKAGVLILILLYAIFCLIIFLQVRGLSRFISFKDNPLSNSIILAFFVHLILVVSLFLVALAIL